MSEESQPLLAQKPYYDPSQVGPVRERRCRDVLFCLLFAVFWAGMVIVGVRGFSEGDPERLLHGQDMNGDLCGIKNKDGGADLREKEYLYWLDPIAEDNFGLQICVEACPSSTTLEGDALTASNVQCRYGVEPTDETAAGLVASGDCFLQYEAQSVLFRCVPLACPGTGAEGDACKEVVDLGDGLSRAYRDLERSWETVLASAFIALAVGFVWLFLLRLFAGIMVWTTLLAAVGGAVAISIALFVKAGTIEAVDGLPVDPADDNQQAMEILAWVSAVLTVILICVICFMMRRINFAIGIVKEASKAVAAMPILVTWPLVPFLASAVVFVYWFVISFWLVSAGEWNEETEEFEIDETLQNMLIYAFFGLLWTLAFVGAVSTTTIAGAVAKWYWSRDKRNLGSPISTALGNVLWYHLGSMAFGSLILSIVSLFRWMFEMVDKRFRDNGGNENPLYRVMACCVRCCLACFERFVKFLNRNAYIQIAIHGDSFCASASAAFGLLLRNILRVAAISVIGDFVISLGKIAIAAGTAFIGFLILSAQDDGADDSIESPLYPTIVIFGLAYVVASVVLAVYSTAMDTILLSFAEDCERSEHHDPYYSDALSDYVDRTSQKA